MAYTPEADMVANYRARARQIGWPALASIAEHAGDELTARWMREQETADPVVLPTDDTDGAVDGSLPGEETNVRVPAGETTDADEAAQKRAAAAEARTADGDAAAKDGEKPQGRRRPGAATQQTT